MNVWTVSHEERLRRLSVASESLRQTVSVLGIPWATMRSRFAADARDRDLAQRAVDLETAILSRVSNITCQAVDASAGGFTMKQTLRLSEAELRARAYDEAARNLEFRLSSARIDFFLSSGTVVLTESEQLQAEGVVRDIIRELRATAEALESGVPDSRRTPERSCAAEWRFAVARRDPNSGEVSWELYEKPDLWASPSLHSSGRLSVPSSAGVGDIRLAVASEASVPPAAVSVLGG